MAEWQDGGMAGWPWRNGGMAEMTEWRNDGMAEWRNGRMAAGFHDEMAEVERRNGGKAERLHTKST